MKNRVALLILNYNRYEKTFLCIESCLKIRSKNMTVVLVDNASTDDSLLRLKQKFRDDIEYLLLDDNWGYAGGNNRAVKTYYEKGYEYSFILNNDVIIKGDNLIVKLVSLMDKYPSCAVVGPTIYNITQDGNEKLMNTSGYIKLLNLFGVVTQKKVLVDENIRLVNEAHGSAIFVKNKRFLEVGGFPEENFMYADESAFAKKIINKGYNILQYSSDLDYVERYDKMQNIDLWRLYLMGRNKVLESRYFPKKKANIGKLCMELSIILKIIRLTDSKEKKAYVDGVKKGKQLLSTDASNAEIFKDAKLSISRYRQLS